MLKHLLYLYFVLLTSGLFVACGGDDSPPIVMMNAGAEVDTGMAGMDTELTSCSTACQSLVACEGFVGCSNETLSQSLNQCLVDCDMNREELISLSELVCEISEPRFRQRYSIGECGQSADLCEGQICGAGFICDLTDGNCIDPCIGVVCPTGECFEGICEDDCAGVECPEGLGCFMGSCTDLCFGVTCASSQMCESSSGQCIDQCGDVTCNLGTRCVEGACIPACQDVECDEGLSCDMNTGECIDRCQEITCAEGYTCNPLSGFCRDSCDNVSCVDGWVCDQGACIYDDPCINSMCTGDNICSLTTGRCERFFCAPDQFESGQANNELPKAIQLRAETQRIDGLTICSLDLDWYTFTLPADASARVSTRFEHHAGNLSLRMYTNNNLLTPALEVNSFNNNEWIGIQPSLEERRFYFRVSSGGEWSEQNRYSLVIEFDLPGVVCNQVSECGDARECTRALCDGVGEENPSDLLMEPDLVDPVDTDPVDPDPMNPVCQDDIFEPNNQLEEAATLSPLNDGPWEVQMCPASNDYYFFTLTETSDVEVMIGFNHELGDLDASLLTSDGDSLSLGVSTDNDESLLVENLEAGNYYLLIYGFGGQISNEYSIMINTQPSANEMNECVIDEECRWDYTCMSGNCIIPQGYCDDTASPNAEYASAYRLSSPSVLNDLTLCESDFYGLSLTEGEEVTWRVNFSNDEGQDIDMKLYRPDGSPIRFSTGFTNIEEISYTADMSGIYTLEVYGYYGFSESLPFITRYSLTVE